jgi:hypothetical protein
MRVTAARVRLVAVQQPVAVTQSVLQEADVDAIAEVGATAAIGALEDGADAGLGSQEMPACRMAASCVS